MSEIRVAVQHALDKLINRFGSQSEVIGELRHVLALIDKAEAPASAGGMDAVTVEPEGEQSPPPVSPEPEKAEPPPTARKRTGRKK